MKSRNRINDDWDFGEEPTSQSEVKEVPRPRRPVMIDIDKIVLGNAGRQINKQKVRQLERSIADQDLRTPIQVYQLRGPHVGKYGLAAGQHRLKAMKNLGCRSIPAVVMKRREARAWRSSENLYRSELRALERSEDIVGYGKERLHLRNVRDDIAFKGGKQPHDQGISKLAAATGFDRKRITEARRHCKLPKSVKNLIRRQPKFNCRATLNALVKMVSEQQQLEYLSEHSESALGRGIRSVKNRNNDISGTRRAEIGTVLEQLRAAWRSSSFRKLFNRQPKNVRAKFVRKFMS
jgi:ParB family chromosome partitioning protein